MRPNNRRRRQSFLLRHREIPGDRPGVQADLARARLLVELKQPAEGAEIFRAAISTRMRSGVPTPKGAEPDAVLAEWGWALLDADKTAEADRVFGRLLSEHPESSRAADARLILAQSAYDAKSYDEVVSLLTPLVAEAAGTPPRLLPSALFLMGRAHDKRAELDEAGKVIDRLLKEFPEDRYRRERAVLEGGCRLAKGGCRGRCPWVRGPRQRAGRRNRSRAVWRGDPSGTDPEPGVLKQWEKVIEAAADFKSFGAKDPLIAEVEYDRGRSAPAIVPIRRGAGRLSGGDRCSQRGISPPRAQLMRVGIVLLGQAI